MDSKPTQIDLVIELSIIFSLVRYEQNLFSRISFLNKEDFVYLKEPFEIVVNNLNQSEAYKLSLLRGHIPVEYIDNYESFVADEDDFDQIVKYANLLREKALLKKVEQKFKLISNKKFSSTEQIYNELKSIQEIIFHNRPSSENIMTIQDILDVFSKEAISQKLSFGFCFGGLDIDKYIYDFVPGNTIVIGARPNIGKTLLSLHIIRKNAEKGIPSHFISLEMKPYQIFTRYISMLSGIPSVKIFRNYLDEEEKIIIEELKKDLLAQKIPIYFTSTFDGSLQNIESLMRKSVFEFGTKLFVIDYLQLMSNPQYNQSRHLEIASIVQRLKNLAIELDVSIVEVSQLSRKLNNKEDPQMSDLKESGDIEQAASLVVLLGDKGEDVIDKVNVGNEEHPIIRKKLLFKVEKQRNGPKFSAIVSFNTIDFSPQVEDILWGSEKSKTT